MIENQANKLSKLLIDHNIIASDDYEVYSYGLQLILATILKGAGLTIIALLMDVFKEFIVFIAFFSVLRVYAGGYHSKSYLNCFITTAISTFALIELAVIFKDMIGLMILTVLLLISCGLVIKFAPIESENKPLSKGQKEKFRKKSIQIVIIQSIIIILVNLIYPQLLIYGSVATFAIFLASITLIPLPKLNRADLSPERKVDI